MRKGLAIGALLALSAASGRAQEPATFTWPYEPQSMAPARAATVVETRITTGRPYSAEATTEFVQTLGDGNKIARKATVRIYRDGEGRTRREELATDGTVKLISIYDPVAHTTYVLDPATRTARKSAVRVVMPTMQPADRRRQAQGRDDDPDGAGGRGACGRQGRARRAGRAARAGRSLKRCASGRWKRSCRPAPGEACSSPRSRART